MRLTPFLPAVAVVAALAPIGAAANEARVLEADDQRITIELATDDYAIESVVRGGESYFRVEADGYGRTAEPGLPGLPLHGVLLGVPFGARVSLDVVSVETENLGPVRVEPAPLESFTREGDFATPVQDHLPDTDFYRGRGSYPPQAATLGFDSTLRHQRVVQVVFHPFQYAASTGELRLHKKIVVTLRMESGVQATGMMPVSSREPEWDAVLAGTVLNHEQARKWLARKAPRRSHLRHALRQDDECYRIEIGETGVYRLDYEDLSSEGLPATLDVDTLAIFQRSFDDQEADPFVETPVPIVVYDADEDGVLDGSDYVLFHGVSYFDQYVVEGYEDRYDTGNVYWFGWGEGLAARMDTRTAWLGATGLTPPASFRDTLRYEEDIYFDNSPSSGFIDYYQWTSYAENDDEHELPFDLYDIDDSEGMILTARYQGMTSGSHRIDFAVRNGLSQVNDIGYFQFTGESFTMSEDIYTSSSIPASYFTDGENTLLTEGSLGRAGSNANLDWFQWSYRRKYEANDGRLRFTNARLTGVQQFEVGGFEGEDIRAFDVTDPWAPVEIELQDENIEYSAGGYSLVLQEDVDDYTRYEAGEASTFLSPRSVERREPANLYADEADMIVVSYDGFAQTTESLVSRRESEGYVVAHALLSDVYDEFGGGLPGPQALRNYFMYAFEEWDRQPQFVLLVGDASEDTRGVLSTSSPDYMPTYLFMGGDDKILASDQWYVRSDQPDYLPQLFIGRLPASGNAQLSNFISKIGTYENYSAADDWRENVLFVADDLWSYVTLTAPYSRKSYESEFTDASAELAGVVAASPAGLDTTNFFLRRYTDPYHGSNTSGDILYAIETADWVRNEGAREDFLELMNDGASIVNFEGHGNRTQFTHEQLLLATGTAVSDIPLIQNDGKPFIFMGFSCELSRFHDSREGSTVDCVTEQLMQLDSGRGAVATFACSGVAFLGPNAVLHRKVYEAFFTDPSPAGEGPYFWPRWSAGGLFAKAMVKYLTAQGSPSLPQTYVLFGDPLMHIDMGAPTIRVTVDGEPHVSGDFLEASEEDVTFVADIIDEVEISPSDIVLEETDTGVVDPEDYTLEAIGDTLGSLSRWHRLTYVAPVRDWSYDIKLKATDANGASTTFTLHVAEGQRILVRDVANHPNPFDAETTIIYLLNQGGADVRIRIFTVGGRLIRVIDDAPGDLNYNSVVWDGRDQDGDEVASGVYLYVIDVEGADGSKAQARFGPMLDSNVGRMVRVGGAEAQEEGSRRR